MLEGSLPAGAEPLSSAALPDLLEMGPGLCHPQGEEGQMAFCTQQTPATSSGLVRAPRHPASHGTAAPSFRHHAGQQPGPTATLWQETARGCTAGGLCSRYHNSFPHFRQPRSPPAFLLDKAPHQGSTGVQKGRGGDSPQPIRGARPPPCRVPAGTQSSSACVHTVSPVTAGQHCLAPGGQPLIHLLTAASFKGTLEAGKMNPPRQPHITRPGWWPSQFSADQQ